MIYLIINITIIFLVSILRMNLYVQKQLHLAKRNPITDELHMDYMRKGSLRPAVLIAGKNTIKKTKYIKICYVTHGERLQ